MGRPRSHCRTDQLRNFEKRAAALSEQLGNWAPEAYETAMKFYDGYITKVKDMLDALKVKAALAAAKAAQA